jgi:hypothetical protein
VLDGRQVVEVRADELHRADVSLLDGGGELGRGSAHEPGGAVMLSTVV